MLRSWALSSGLSGLSFGGVPGAFCKHPQCRCHSSAIAVGTDAAEGGGQAGGRLLLRALPIQRSRLGHGERKQQMLRCGPGAERTPLGCRRACTCCHEAPVTLAHCVARASLFIPPLSETRSTANICHWPCLCHLVLQALQSEQPKGLSCRWSWWEG